MHDIKNQRGCGSCWAFSTTTVLEAMASIKNEKDNGAAPHAVRLSEQQLVDCTYDERHGCDGGWPSKGVLYGNENGIRKASDYHKYDSKDHRCRVNRGDYANRTPYLTPSQQIDELRGGKVHEIAKRLKEVGPIDIVLWVGKEFQQYRSGVLTVEQSRDWKQQLDQPRRRARRTRSH